MKTQLIISTICNVWFLLAICVELYDSSYNVDGKGYTIFLTVMIIALVGVIWNGVLWIF